MRYNPQPENDTRLIPLKDDNPTSITPVLTWLIIALNVAVFLYQFSLPPRAGQAFVFQFGAVPAVVLGSVVLPPGLAVIPAGLSLFTSMFLHGGWLHLAGNMLYLWIFGNNIEEAMGRVRFVVFYLLCGLGAAAAHILSSAGSTIPIVGASGAISGVLGAYLLLYPRARVLVLIPLGFFTRLMYIPAGIVLGFWFLLQVFQGSMTSGEGGGVAWWAHIGGFVFGMMLVGLFKRRHVRFFSPPQHHESRIANWQ
jgi:membrane associated rhomboid family serine protease